MAVNKQNHKQGEFVFHQMGKKFNLNEPKFILQGTNILQSLNNQDKCIKYASNPSN